MWSRGIMVGAALLFSAAAQAASIPLVPGPLDPSQTQGTINGVINQINGILSPLTGGPSPLGPGVSGTNVIGLFPANSGSPGQIVLQPGGDPNAAIAITPNGNGNLVLFGAPGQPGQPWASSSTGMLQFGNAAGFIRANALAPCPGMATNRPPMLGIPATVVTGFFEAQDWLGFVYAVPACGNQFGASLRGSY